MTNYPIHPACALWPRPSDEEVNAIAEGMKTEGLLNPIWLFEGAILDGKIRYEACGIAGVEPRFETYTGDDPIRFSIAQNRERRHISPADLTFVVAELCKLQRGRPKLNSLSKPFIQSEEKTIDTLSKEAGIGRSNVVAAKSVLQDGESNIVEMVRSNKVGVQSAAYFVRNTPRKLQHEATIEQVKKSRDNFSQQKKGKSKDDRTIAVPRRDLDKFRLLIKRVKEQSDRHAATVSFMALRIIAFELKQLADSWMKNEAEPETHSAPVPINSVHKGR